jgi:hypothetical protein
MARFQLDMVQQKKEDPKDTSSETKKMTGFSDIASVAAAAPSSSGEFAAPAGRSAGKTPRTAVKAEEKKKEEEKNKLVEEALSKVGAEMMKELASLPYEAWAFFFSDPALRLTEAETKQLADSYYMIAKALKPEQMTSWKVLLALALLQNTRIVIGKLRESAKRQEAQKKLQQSDGYSDIKIPDITVI